MWRTTISNTTKINLLIIDEALRPKYINETTINKALKKAHKLKVLWISEDRILIVKNRKLVESIYSGYYVTREMIESINSISWYDAISESQYLRDMEIFGKTSKNKKNFFSKIKKKLWL